MAHGTGDSTHTTTPGAGTGDAGTGGAAERERPTGRVATGRFASARSALARVRGGDTGEEPTRDTGEETERDRQARVARALRVAQGDEDEGNDTDWRAVGFFSAGLTLGALLGAGIALLLAPATGFETRTRLVRSVRRSGDRIRKGARKGGHDLRRSVSRQLTRGRWAAEDVWDRGRRRRRDEED